MASKTADRMSETLDRLLQEIKLEDLLVMSAGAIAGSQGYTPMSAMIKAIAGGGSVDTGAGAMVAKAIPLWASPGLSGSWIFAAGPLMPLVAFLLGPQTTTPTENMTPEQQQAYVNKWALAAVGMIEAYAITRPGAIQGIADIVGNLAGIVQGVGSNAAAAGMLKA